MNRNHRSPSDYRKGKRNNSHQPVQQLQAWDICNAARTIALGLTADQCRTLIPIARDSQVGQDARKAVSSIATSMMEDSNSFELPPPEFAGHTVAMRRPALVQLAERNSRLLLLPAASALLIIATLVVIGLSIAQIVHPGVIAITAILTLVSGFAARWNVHRQEILLGSDWQGPVWSMIICVLLEGAIHKGQLSHISPTPEELESLMAANTLFGEVFSVQVTD